MAVADPDIRPDRLARGIVLILLSTFLTASQDTIFKQASAEVSLWQLYVLRSVFLIPALLVIAQVWGDGPATWRQSLQVWPMLRALFFVLMYMAIYSALPVLPLSAVAAGLYTAPLFVAALSAPLLGETVGWRGRIAIAVGFAGVLIILRPGSEAFTAMMLLPVAGGFFYALSAITTRSRCRSTPTAALALSLSLALLATGAIASVALAVWQPGSAQIEISPFLLGSWRALDLQAWGFIALLAALMAANGLVLPAAYQSAPSAMIATFDYGYLIFATLLGFLVFSEIPDFQTIVGMLMIAGAGLMIARN